MIDKTRQSSCIFVIFRPVDNGAIFHSFVKAIWVVDSPSKNQVKLLDGQQHERPKKKNRTKSLKPKRRPFEKRHKTDSVDELGENAEKRNEKEGKVQAGKNRQKEETAGPTSFAYFAASEIQVFGANRCQLGPSDDLHI